MSIKKLRFSGKIISELLSKALRIINGLIGNQSYKDRMLNQGYTDTAYQEMQDATTTAYDLSQQHLTARQLKRSKCKTTKNKLKACKANYGYYNQRIRDRYRGDDELLHKLAIPGSTESSYTGFSDQAQMFYTTALTDEDARTKLEAIGITSQAIQEGLDLLNAFRTAWEESETAKGHCQRLVEARDQAIKELRKLLNALIVSCRHEFKDTPQALEVLGIFVRNSSTKNTKTNTEPTEPSEPTEPTTTEPATQPAARTA